LFSLEEKLAPPEVRHPWPRDLLGAGLVIALAAVLVPAAGIDWRGLADDSQDAEAIQYRQVVQAEFLTDVAGQMASFYLLPAIGFCLALRCGAIDLSVWAVASLGGIVAAWLINAGVTPAWAFAAACGAGLLFGAVNAVSVALARLPSPIVTIIMALGLMWGLQAVVPQRGLAVPGDTFTHWQLPARDAPAAAGQEGEESAGEPPRTRWLPIQVTRMVVVAVAYAAVMGAIFVAGPPGRGPRAGRRALTFASLCASGLLCGIAGPCWLIEHNVAPVPTRPIGDLRVVAAPLLAGAAFFAGRGRAMLACLCLPAAMLIVTIWRQEIRAWDMEFDAYSLQLAQLAVMVVAAHLAMARLLSRRYERRLPAATAAVLTTLGILVTAAAAWAEHFSPAAALYLAGAALWFCGLVALLLEKRWAMGKSASGPWPGQA